MKHLINYFSITCIILFSILSCTPDNPPPNPPTNNTVAVSWQATIDGVSYSYTGTYLNGESTSTDSNNPGDCNYGGPSINLKKGVFLPGNQNIYIAIEKYPLALGTYIITSNTGSNPGMSIQINNTTIGHSYYPNTNITFNVTEYPNIVGGMLKGNFSGIIGTSISGGGTMPVSGQFEALRIL